MLDKHADDVLILDLRTVSSMADFFVIATAQTHRQVHAIADHLDEALRTVGWRPQHVEGLSDRPSTPLAGRNAGDDLLWVLVDCGSVVVHLFNPSAREFYQLERLWGDAPRVPMDEPSAGAAYPASRAGH